VVKWFTYFCNVDGVYGAALPSALIPTAFKTLARLYPCLYDM
jgi:hypothetical protein